MGPSNCCYAHHPSEKGVIERRDNAGEYSQSRKATASRPACCMFCQASGQQACRQQARNREDGHSLLAMLHEPRPVIALQAQGIAILEVLYAHKVENNVLQAYIQLDI